MPGGDVNITIFSLYTPQFLFESAFQLKYYLTGIYPQTV